MFYFNYCKTATIILLILITIELNLVYSDLHTAFHYPHYPYRKKKPSERKIRGAKSKCDYNYHCLQLTGLKNIECVRKCMSENCYDQIYQFDELEEGEIDIRYNSFKGCVLEELKKTSYSPAQVGISPSHIIVIGYDIIVGSPVSFHLIDLGELNHFIFKIQRHLV